MYLFDFVETRASQALLNKQVGVVFTDQQRKKLCFLALLFVYNLFIIYQKDDLIVKLADFWFGKKTTKMRSLRQQWEFIFDS